MKKKSSLFVLILLVFPVIVVVFLHNFGVNRFDIPVFHEKYTEELPECVKNRDFPIKITKSDVGFIPDSDSLKIVLIADLENNLSIDKLQGLRLCSKIEGKPISVLTIYSENPVELSCGRTHKMERKQLGEVSSCLFLIPKGNNTVLLDGKGRVRGYYNCNDREETDRLAIEIDILIQNNEYERGD